MLACGNNKTCFYDPQSEAGTALGVWGCERRGVLEECAGPEETVTIEVVYVVP